MPGFVSKLSPDEWAEVRRLRAAGASYGQLAARFGLRAATIGKRARKEGWASANDAGPAPAGAAGAAARAPSPATAEVRRDLALRLYHLIDIQIRMLELRMKADLEAQQKALEAGEPAPPIKDERETFAALIEQINQVTEMASEPASAAHGRRKPGVNPELGALSGEIDAGAFAAASEKDALRRDLAERLGALFPNT